MATSELITERMRKANPVPHVSAIPEDQLAELRSRVEIGQRQSPGSSSGELLRVTRPERRGWLPPIVALGAAAVLTTAVIGVASLATSEQDDSAAALSSLVATPVARDWASILATTDAGAAPLAGACDAGSSPDRPGATEQDRPRSGWSGSLAGVFDHSIGEIIYVDDRLETWAFDVCSNSWRRLDPSGDPPENPSGGLVYDIDSGVSVAMGHEIGVFDATANAWTYPDTGQPSGPGDPFGAVYDPISGLIITTVYPTGIGGEESSLEAWAYNVDTNAWTRLGVIGVESEDVAWRYDLIGYLGQLDRLILVSPPNASLSHTMLLDPRTGEREMIWTETPVIGFTWPQSHYGPALDTVFVAGVQPKSGADGQDPVQQICGFEAGELAWTSCWNGPTRGVYGPFIWFGAMVDDPRNDRLVLVNGLFGEFGSVATDDVWAINPDTGELVELLEPRN